MKTKLLKKIRKQYSIVYYPCNGWYEIDFGYIDCCDIAVVILSSNITIQDRIKDGGYNQSRTLQGAKDKLLKFVRLEYYKYSRKYKLSKINYKVWYNESV